MGYYTDYTITVGNFEDEAQREAFLRCDKTADKFYIGDPELCQCFATFWMGDCKWYNWQEDLLEVSELWPTLNFEVHGSGEETGDVWRAQIKNGKSEIVKASLVFAPFTKQLFN